MGFKPPKELIASAAGAGAGKPKQSATATAGLTFLAGAYIALGGFLAIRCANALPANIWGSMGKLIFAAVFPLGLMLVVVCGADLFTGNCLTLTAAWYRSKISLGQVVKSLVTSWAGNFVGAFFVAYFMAYATGIIFEAVKTNGVATMPWAQSVVALANAKCSFSFSAAFWRAVGCNWLVCLAVYAAMSAEDIGGKILALWFPTMGFVALGMEHCVANMFFVPLGIFTGLDPRYHGTALQIDWSGFFAHNLLPVTLGNIVGGALFVGLLYCLIYKEDK